MDPFLLTKYAVTSFTQALLATLVTAYLLLSVKKDCSAWRLIMFFAALTLSLCGAFFLIGVNTPWRSTFGPVQGILSLLGLVAMIQFAYTFPGGETSGRSRRALILSAAAVLLVVVVGAVYGAEAQAIPILVSSATGVALSAWSIVVFALRSRAYTRDSGGPTDVLSALRQPAGREARAHRAFALLMALYLIYSLLTLAESVGWVSLQKMIAFLSSFNMLFLVAFVFVYVNYAPSESSFMVKIVGLSLATLLIVMGNMGTFILSALERRFDEDRQAEMKFALRSVVEDDPALLPDHVDHIHVYPLESEGGADGGEAVYTRTGMTVGRFHAGYVSPVFTANIIRAMRADSRVGPSVAKERALEAINRTDVVRWGPEYGFDGMAQDLRCSLYYFTVTGFLFEVAYDPAFYGGHIDGYALSLILFVLGSTILILLFFPRFFKSSLNAPLQALVGGMRAVNDGDTTVEVPIRTEDEFGYLTRSFNGMVRSIREAEAKLRDYASELESRVDERTRDLNEKNAELERAMVELHDTQNQLLMQEKMASVGQLVAGLAHEINNPIGAVSSSADVARRCIERIEAEIVACDSIDDLRNSATFTRALGALADNVDVTTRAGERIARIVGTLRSFSRLDEAEYQVVRIEEGIESTVALMRHQVPDGIDVVIDFGETPPIHCAPGELNQVFMGLIRNAITASGESGRIEIQTTLVDGHVCVTIGDKGAGIPKERLDRIFEIGFNATGDRVKMGTGLTTAYRVVSDHGGVINIESRVGEGTTVDIRLPVGTGG